MKCPKCGKELILRNEQVSVNTNGDAVYNEFAVCMDCRKKWNLDKQRAKQKAGAQTTETAAQTDSDEHETVKTAPEKPQTPVRKKTAVKKPADHEFEEEAPVRRERPSRPDGSNTGAVKQGTKRPAGSKSSSTAKSRPAVSGKEDPGQTYSNIPPKEIREKREQEMRKGYEDLLAYSEEEERRGSKAPIVILVILLVIAIGIGATLIYFKVTGKEIPFLNTSAKVEQTVEYEVPEEEPVVTSVALL